MKVRESGMPEAGMWHTFFDPAAILDAMSLTGEVRDAVDFGDALTAKGPVDGYVEIGAGSDGVVLTTARESLKGCCAACAVPIGAFKAMQVAAGVALPEDITLRMSAE